MHGVAKVPFVRHSVQREGQSFPDQTARFHRRPCKNRGAAAVPQKDRTDDADGRRKGLKAITVGPGQTVHPSRSGTDGPVG